ncbi:MAG: hypothetical protein ACYCPQ_01645 [Elusimicrobiota bacterium]
MKNSTIFSGAGNLTVAGLTDASSSNRIYISTGSAPLPLQIAGAAGQLWESIPRMIASK